MTYNQFLKIWLTIGVITFVVSTVLYFTWVQYPYLPAFWGGFICFVFLLKILKR